MGPASPLVDPYTGRTIRFSTGSNTVDIDHVVALENVWQSGAYEWNTAQRMRIANDPLNLIAADSSSNRSKGGKSADQWLPTNPSFQCTYVKRQVQVKNKYRLHVSAAEKKVMTRFAGRC